jgi:phospholipase C
MKSYRLLFAALVGIAVAGLPAERAFANGDIKKVKHIIIVMQENHSFDNYFGALAYAPGSPYHTAPGACSNNDHNCVDGLTCNVDSVGNLTCFNYNLDDGSTRVSSFHDPRRCAAPDLDHSWPGTHKEANFSNPNATLAETLSDGFVRVNDTTEQFDTGGENVTEDQTMGFYTHDDLPFYYDLAANFAINDRYFSSVLGGTFSNRAYFVAATSFGHLSTFDEFPPPGGYKPITGTIFDLLDQHGIAWADYFQDAPQGASFRPFGAPPNIDPHFVPLQFFFAQAAGSPQLPPLPQISFVDPNFGLPVPNGGIQNQNDEHPPTDIQRGQAFVSRVVNAVRNGPFWQDSAIFITYDEHGGYYDHVEPPKAQQSGARTPDGISPGQCADLSNPPLSLLPGGGAECGFNLSGTLDTSVGEAELLCPELITNPTGPYPDGCASYDQLGFRVPLMVVSPFAKPHYVSHTVGDHTSLLAFIEKRFLSLDNPDERLHLTNRDLHANTLEDMFDFTGAPSLTTTVGQALPPATDCTPH